MIQVVLRDFDGAETVIERAAPLPQVIHTGEADSPHFLTMRHYVRTTEVDSEGRAVYVQSNL